MTPKREKASLIINEKEYPPRPRCKDGSLDMRRKVNRAFDKYADVGDYYDPS